MDDDARRAARQILKARKLTNVSDACLELYFEKFDSKALVAIDAVWHGRAHPEVERIISTLRQSETEDISTVVDEAEEWNHSPSGTQSLFSSSAIDATVA